MNQRMPSSTLLSLHSHLIFHFSSYPKRINWFNSIRFENEKKQETSIAIENELIIKETVNDSTLVTNMKRGML
jgi:hypothetical protein